MAHLRSKMDMMHVPTPQVVIDRLRDFLDVPPTVHALDPCCGTGLALRRLVPQGTRYGIELDIARATQASKRLERVVGCAFQDARVSHDSMGLVLLNPPYDDSLHGRLEISALERAVNWLAPRGVLVYIVKRQHYSTGRVLSLLWRYFTDFEHWRFPDPYYDGPDLAYQQTVLICRRRASINPPCRDLEGFRVRELKLDSLEPFIPPVDRKYAVPAAQGPALFISGRLDAPAMAELIKTSTLKRRPARVAASGFGRPPLPLKRGHIALMLAGGLVDGVHGGTNGHPLHVAKGTVKRRQTDKWEVEVNDEGQPTATQTVIHAFEVVIRALTPDGIIHDVNSKKSKDVDEPQLADAEEPEEAAA